MRAAAIPTSPAVLVSDHDPPPEQHVTGEVDGVVTLRKGVAVSDWLRGDPATQSATVTQ